MRDLERGVGGGGGGWGWWVVVRPGALQHSIDLQIAPSSRGPPAPPPGPPDLIGQPVRPLIPPAAPRHHPPPAEKERPFFVVVAPPFSAKKQKKTKNNSMGGGWLAPGFSIRANLIDRVVAAGSFHPTHPPAILAAQPIGASRLLRRTRPPPTHTYARKPSNRFAGAWRGFLNGFSTLP